MEIEFSKFPIGEHTKGGKWLKWMCEAPMVSYGGIGGLDWKCEKINGGKGIHWVKFLDE